MWLTYRCWLVLQKPAEGSDDDHPDPQMENEDDVNGLDSLDEVPSRELPKRALRDPEFRHLAQNSGPQPSGY